MQMYLHNPDGKCINRSREAYDKLIAISGKKIHRRLQQVPTCVTFPTFWILSPGDIILRDMENRRGNGNLCFSFDVSTAPCGRGVLDASTGCRLGSKRLAQVRQKVLEHSGSDGYAKTAVEIGERNAGMKNGFHNMAPIPGIKP